MLIFVLFHSFFFSLQFDEDFYFREEQNVVEYFDHYSQNAIVTFTKWNVARQIKLILDYVSFYVNSV